MLVYVPSRMASRQIGAHGVGSSAVATLPGTYGQPILVQPIAAPPSPPLSPEFQNLPHQQTRMIFPPSNSQATSTIKFPDVPIWAPAPPTFMTLVHPNFGMTRPIVGSDSDKLHLGLNSGTAVVPIGAPPSPAYSDSDNSNSSFEVALNKTEEIAKLSCRWQSCGQSFLTLEQLANHVSRFHAAPGPKGLFYCGWEGCARGERGFNARYKMLVHVRTHTNEKPHQCTQCDKSFSRAENLKIHARSHTGERPYVCPVEGCNKAYSNSSDRFKHTRTHAVDKPYCCKVPGCPKRYTDPSSLRKHVKTYRHYINSKHSNKSDNASRGLSKIGVEVIMNQISAPQAGDPIIKDTISKSDSTSVCFPIHHVSNSSDNQQTSTEWNYSPSFNVSDEMDHYELNEITHFHPKYTSATSEYHQASRVNLQSAPIKQEEKIVSGVDYRNIDSIVNSSSNSTIVRNVNPGNFSYGSFERNSVIKRTDSYHETAVVTSKNRIVTNEDCGYQVHKEHLAHCKQDILESCCHQKCCKGAENEGLFENTNILADLLVKAENPMLKTVLGSFNISCDFYGTRHRGTFDDLDNRSALFSNYSHKVDNIHMGILSQDLPLDLTINK